MKHMLLAFFVCLLACQGWAQQVDSRNLPPFTQIEFTGRGNLYLTPGDQESVRVEIPDGDDIRQVKTQVRGNTLHIEFEKDEQKKLAVDPKLNIYLSYRQLEAIKATGIVNVYTEQPITGNAFSFVAEGMGKSRLAVALSEVEISCAGTANVTLEGTAEHGTIKLNGTSTIDAFNLNSKRMVAEVNGTGSILVNATESLQAAASGFGAEIRYRGNPEKTDFNTSGFAKVRRE